MDSRLDTGGSRPQHRLSPRPGSGQEGQPHLQSRSHRPVGSQHAATTAGTLKDLPKGEVPGGSQGWGQVTRPNRCSLWIAGSLVWGQLPGGGALGGCSGSRCSGAQGAQGRVCSGVLGAPWSSCAVPLCEPAAPTSVPPSSVKLPAVFP